MRVAASPGRLRGVWRRGAGTWQLRGRCSIAVRQLKHGIAKAIRPCNAPSIAAGIESRSCWWSGGPLQLAGLERLDNPRYFANGQSRRREAQKQRGRRGSNFASPPPAGTELKWTGREACPTSTRSEEHTAEIQSLRQPA